MGRGGQSQGFFGGVRDEEFFAGNADALAAVACVNLPRARLQPNGVTIESLAFWQAPRGQPPLPSPRGFAYFPSRNPLAVQPSTTVIVSAAYDRKQAPLRSGSRAPELRRRNT